MGRLAEPSFLTGSAAPQPDASALFPDRLTQQPKMHALQYSSVEQHNLSAMTAHSQLSTSAAGDGNAYAHATMSGGELII